MTKAERTLANNGDAMFVLDMRHRFQHAMRDDLVAAAHQGLAHVATDEAGAAGHHHTRHQARPTPR